MTEKIYKLYCIVSKEAIKKMGGNRGKMINQGGHAFLHACWDAEERFPDDYLAYKNSKHAYKISVAVETTAELEIFKKAYYDVCGVSLVKDAGFTVFSEPTITYLGLGPIREDLIGEDLSSLKVFL